MNSLKRAKKIHELRGLLGQRFPEAHASRPREDELYPTGVDCLDNAGIRRGAITEIACLHPSAGGGLILAGLLLAASKNSQRLALIDGRDAFDPQSIEPSTLPHLLWLRCRQATEAIKAADLIVRDGNHPLIALDLRFNPSRELQGVPSNCWHRIRGVVDDSGCTLLVFTPHRTVGCASLRLSLQKPLPPAALDRTRAELHAQLRPAITRGAERRLQKAS